MAMVIVAAGHNAWGQLWFGDQDAAATEESGDIFTFTKVLEGHNLSRPQARLAYTNVVESDLFHQAGIRRNPDLADPELFAEAANGVILAATTGQAPTLARYRHRGDYLDTKTNKTWPCKCPVLDIVAYDAGFAVLFKDGTVATLGDARYQDCLARHVTLEQPADEPGPVPDLENLGDPVKHISAAGCAIVALAESGSLYVWGRAAPSRGDPVAFKDICGVPNYVEVGDGKDVRDVALGESHAITMTTDSRVYVRGGNANGQLGLGLSADDSIDTWAEVNLDICGYKAVSVSAGPRSSFVVMSRT